MNEGRTHLKNRKEARLEEVNQQYIDFWGMQMQKPIWIVR